MITIKASGSFDNIERFLKNAKKPSLDSLLNLYAQRGVSKLSEATPKDSGETASKWSYVIEKKQSGYSISWHNSNIEDGVPIVILLQYGHSTKNGSWVEGRDFINPAMKPIFDELSNDLWKEVTQT